MSVTDQCPGVEEKLQDMQWDNTLGICSWSRSLEFLRRKTYIVKWG